jgi:hypothetical protein
MNALRFRPEKVVVGTAYVYEKSNIDGSNKSNIVQYVASKDALEAFKYESGPEATLVTATMDWNTFSVRDLSSWKVRSDGERTLVVNLHQQGNSNQIIVGGKLRSQKLDQTTTMEYYPWHSYDFDFASLNLILPHLIDPWPASRSE